MTYIRTSTHWQNFHFLKLTAYTFFLLLLQVQGVSRLPYPALRIDLFLPLMFGVAIEWPPVASIFWGCVWGFAMDVLSGKFWGFHLGSYVVAICLVNIGLEKFEFQNPLYQMSFVGMCALGQSVALGLYLLFEPAGSISMMSMWMSLAVRSLIMMLCSPLILYPIWSGRKDWK
ncbi:rod shape-determining protein MreD [Desulforhabdus amnigena]|uniref:Rod shape-determining protein MreD n=1 Tax=Desulforhabdus amnigena TaxID=40218 RepID=A0A9W6L8E0_9BACT|nr:rod shape-determining protein MreD [Desulforhabdus amnigena]NLJ28531.1 rod shape-determining protein MreD [Deltaproteobacteria bacterium]GLI35608.1 hypothetical protein DAMNIGENAA_30410 [Desulforhabdus amnigena]